MTRHQRLGAIWLTAVLALGFVFVAGCNTEAEADPTPVTTWKITPASGTPRPSPTAAATATSGAVGAEVVISTTAATLKFDQTTPRAKAGTVRITFDNKDSGVPHNIQFFNGGDASAPSLGATDTANGPIKQQLTLDLTPGQYYFQCDVHPTTMKGTLTVE
jgi:plastocyanin